MNTSKRARQTSGDKDPIADDTPVRGPGRDTLDNILTAAGQVLDDAGYEGLSTTAVAQQAGVSTATVYRHFPDKHAVLRALVIRLQSERAASFVPLYEQVATAPDWRVPLAEATRTAFRLRQERPGGHTSRRAMQTSPELWQWDLRQTEEMAQALGRAFSQREPALKPAVAYRVALTAITATSALLDLASLDKRHGKALVEEAILQRDAYLTHYLGVPRASSTRKKASP